MLSLYSIFVCVNYDLSYRGIDINMLELGQG